MVIPTHNRRELVLRAVQSVLDQAGVPRLQVVVVDDASSDDTLAALQQRYHDDARVELLSTTRRYACGARNLGFDTARGNFVCFLDSDDFWLPGVARAMLEVFDRHPELAFVSVDGSTLPTPGVQALQQIVAGDSPGWSHAWFARAPLAEETITLAAVPGTRRLLRGDFFPAIVNGDLFYLSGMIIRRDAVLAAGPFNERFRYYNDWEFFARLCLQGPGAYLELDGFRRDTGRADQISRNRPRTALARRHLFIAHSLSRNAAAAGYAQILQHALSDAHYGMARSLAGAARARLARRYLRRCLRERHKMLRCLALLAGWR